MLFWAFGRVVVQHAFPFASPYVRKDAQRFYQTARPHLPSLSTPERYRLRSRLRACVNQRGCLLPRSCLLLSVPSTREAGLGLL